MSKTTIMVVEDDLDLLSLYGMALSLVGGDTIVETYSDGQAALNRADRLPAPGIAVLDLHLPKVTGSEVFRHIRRKTPNTRIVIVSADYELAQTFHGKADAVILKPIRMSDFQQIVSGFLESER